jgi:4-amino-4-deoxy-L-arabinose transferase-like glycosyltransferase
MLLALVWLRRGSKLALAASGIFLGLAILAKGLVPLVLSAPLVWFGRRRIQDLVWLAAAALLIAAPWYAAVTLRHGSEFVNEFFWRHHFERFASESLQHVRPFWFYIPVIFAGIFPWTPLLLSLFRRTPRDVTRTFLAAIVVFGFVFFSLSRNKLPGYLLPLFPALCALLGLSLAAYKQSDGSRPVRLLTACAALLGLVPVAGSLLPQALQSGLSRSSWDLSWVGMALAFALATLVWFASSRGRMTAAVSLIAAGAVIGVVYLKIHVLPQVDHAASARDLWSEVKPVANSVCVTPIHRNWRYGLNYYSKIPLPDCSLKPAKLQIVQESGNRPQLFAR